MIRAFLAVELDATFRRRIGEAQRGLRAALSATLRHCARITLPVVRAGVGIPADDRLFRPHLTLARVRSGERRVGRALAESGALDRPFPAGTLAIAGVALMKGDLHSDRAVHTRLWEIGPFS